MYSTQAICAGQLHVRHDNAVGPSQVTTCCSLSSRRHDAGRSALVIYASRSAWSWSHSSDCRSDDRYTSPGYYDYSRLVVQRTACHSMTFVAIGISFPEGGHCQSAPYMSLPLSSLPLSLSLSSHCSSSARRSRVALHRLIGEWWWLWWLWLCAWLWPWPSCMSLDRVGLWWVYWLAGFMDGAWWGAGHSIRRVTAIRRGHAIYLCTMRRETEIETETERETETETPTVLGTCETRDWTRLRNATAS